MHCLQFIVEQVKKTNKKKQIKNNQDVYFKGQKFFLYIDWHSECFRQKTTEKLKSDGNLRLCYTASLSVVGQPNRWFPQDGNGSKSDTLIVTEEQHYKWHY